MSIRASAPAKKSFFIANWPVLACNSFTLGPFTAMRLAAVTNRSVGAHLQLDLPLYDLVRVLYCWYNWVRVLSLRKAAIAVLALKVAA